RILPTTVEFVDIAGLVAGASKGEGLGNKFLAHIREVDAIAHVVRCFENDDIVHVAGKIDPAGDIEVINNELALLRDMHLLTDKPVMYVANVDEAGFSDNPRLDRVRALAEAEGSVVVPVCAAIEAEISQLEEADRADFLKELKLDEPGLNRVIRGAYALLGLQTYF